MKMRTFFFATSIFAVFQLLSPCQAQSQHLFWNLEGQPAAVCLYGEITVLATNPGIYYCGANWFPGEPAGGYCGIQHLGPDKRVTIFSIWDTSKELQARMTQRDPRTAFRRYGNEGSGMHTDMDWNWKLGETFQFFVQKRPGSAEGTTDARYYVFDRAAKKWLFSATITNPNGGHRCVAAFGGMLNSFLENFSGRDPAAPKLALYRLWLGPSVDRMKCLTRANGDSNWGVLGNAYFLSAGDKARVNAVFADAAKAYGKPKFGGEKIKLDPIPDQPLPAETVDALKIPPAPPAQSTP